jgi:DNA invertase Pin-like site-specific DNA recombinase
MTAYGYLRKSVMPDPSKTLSPQVQEERIRALAKARGDDDLVLLSDLDVSGAKVEQRPDYMRLVEAIESGEAHAVYAYDLSRLHRNTKEALRFFELARDHDVPVRLVADSIDTSTASGRLMLTILAAMNAWTSEVTSEKIRASLALKRAAGWRPGRHPYGEGEGEDAQAVVHAYRVARSGPGAARALNTAGVARRNHSTRAWSAGAVRAVVKRLAPDLLSDPAEASGRRGSRGGDRRYRFARLLRCSICGSTLTPMADARTGTVRYYCWVRRVDPKSHPRYAVSESALIPAVLDELMHLPLRRIRQQVGSVEDLERQASLEAERTRIVSMHRKGDLSEDEYDAMMGEVRAGLESLNVRRWLTRIPIAPEIRSSEPQTVNRYLRTVFKTITVDMGQPSHRGKPVPTSAVFEWTDPSLRLSEALEDPEDWAPLEEMRSEPL